MNQYDRTVGGGIADLVAGHGNVGSPGAFDFIQNSEPVIKMAGGGVPSDYFDETLYEDLGFAPVAAPAPVVQAPTVKAFPSASAPAPAQTVAAPVAPAPTPGVQFTPERNLPPQQVQSTNAGIASLTPVQAPVAAPAVAAPAPSPFGMSLDQVAGGGLGPVTGADLGISAPAKAPAPSPAQAPSPAAAPAQQGYTPYSGELSSALMKLTPSSGSDIYGKWQFDTQSDRDRADYEAKYGFNPESGQAYSASDRKSTRLNSSHVALSRMPSSA